MIFRTEAQKKDQALSWRRCDRTFFASGACHVLAREFLRLQNTKGQIQFFVVGRHLFSKELAMNERPNIWPVRDGASAPRHSR